MIDGLRAGTPSQRRARSSVRRKGLSGLHHRLWERDFQICDLLFEHRCLTTHQIQDLLFDSPRITRQRLGELTQMEMVDRFRPLAYRGEGSHPYHYVLGSQGARIVASMRDVDLRELGYRKDHFDRVAYSARLPHLLDVNTFFSRLAWACRRRGEGFDWWSEAGCARIWGSFARPDGYGSVDLDGRSVSFFLELDRGTERPWRLAEKLDGYSQAAHLEDCPDLLLFCFTEPRAERAARKALVGCGMTIATAVLDDHIEDPLGPIWRMLGSASRKSLEELTRD